LVGTAELSRPPRYCVFRPGTKSFLLAYVISSRRAVDRSSDQPVVRCEASIRIISNVLGDDTQAIGITRGRPVWLRCHRLTVGVRRSAARLSLASFRERHRVTTGTNGPEMRSWGCLLIVAPAWFYFYSVQSRDIHAASVVKRVCKKELKKQIVSCACVFYE
jgi:hypothetical protein